MKPQRSTSAGTRDCHYFYGGDRLFEETVRHTKTDLALFDGVREQGAYRKRLIDGQMRAHGIPPCSLNAVVRRYADHIVPQREPNAGRIAGGNGYTCNI